MAISAKQRKPLLRKKSLRQSYADRIRREGIPQKACKPLRKMSAKREALLPARKACCEEVRRRSRGHCEVIMSDCTGRMDHTHEIKPRSAGGSITDPENCLAACFACHTWIHEHANSARALGFLV